MLRYLTGLVALFLAGTLPAQTQLLTGRITDTAGNPLAAVSVALLHPDDSTLALFSVSNDQGYFHISEVKPGAYLMQAALMGYYTTYKPLSAPLASGDLGTITLSLNEASQMLHEVVISGEKIPLQIRGDTFEYNAGSYKVRPDAVVEDLLRKLPGVQVDKEGNVKSMGKTVRKVLVDGKEFFGNDPKVATKNLPADAVDKIQAFEKRSEESLFTGIDDGQREQTLNLVLKEGKKGGYFGEASGGAGLPEQYEGSLRAFRFRPKSQLAALGMYNNINKFGFTFEDYLNFNGGIGSLLSSGGSMQINADEVPMDLGLPVTGDVRSGAAGLNYTLEPWKQSRLNLSYMGNGMQKLLQQQTTAQNYTPQAAFARNTDSRDDSRNQSHRLSLQWRNTIDSLHQVDLSLYGQVGSSGNKGNSYTQTFLASALQNYLDNQEMNEGRKTELGGTLRWVKKGGRSWPKLQATLQALHSGRTDDSRWHNCSYFVQDNNELTDRQYRDNRQARTGAKIQLSATRSLGKGYYLEPALGMDMERASNDRQQGQIAAGDLPTDSLSPDFYRDVRQVYAGMQLQRSRKGVQWAVGAHAMGVWLSPVLNRLVLAERNYRYLLPFVRWQKDLAAGTRVSLNYKADINAPDALQLLPQTDYSNPLNLAAGNPLLRPEYLHNLGINYSRFDQFTMSSFFVALNGSYTRDKIGWSRTVMPDLSQRMLTVNTPQALGARLSAQYERPVPKLGINIALGLNESWNSTESPVNGVANRNNTLSHELALSGNNLGNDIWDVRAGGSITLSAATYSLQRELNNRYTNYTAFAAIGYRPSPAWHIEFSTDLTHYTARSFDQPLTIPLMKAGLTRYVLPNQRGSITLRGFDLLDRNRAILRSSQLNTLMEQRSNTIGRYVMLSFGYRLNRAGSSSGMPGGVRVRKG